MAITWVFNAASGSDTAASGAGPGNGIVSGTVLTGTNASFSGSVVTLDGSPNLSAFDSATWGLWLQTSTGRQFFDLSSANDGADTVTCVNAPAGTASGLTWAIGGKRQTIDGTNSRLLFTADHKSGQSFYFEDDQTITTSGIAWYISPGNAKIRVYGPSGRATITQTANTYHFQIGGTSGNTPIYCFENLKFVNSNGTKTSAKAIVANGIGSFIFRNCVFGDSTNKLLNGISLEATFSTTQRAACWDCMFDSCTGAGFLIGSGNSNMSGMLHGCTIRSCNNASSNNAGIDILATNEIHVHDCTIHGGSKSGIYIANLDESTTITRNVIHSNTGATSDGVTVAAIVAGIADLIIHSNNITANGRYGINVPATNYYVLSDYNNYGTGSTANTSGARNNLTAGDHDLAVDPGYVDAANYDFATGANVKALGFPDSTRKIGANPTLGTTGYYDIGIQQQAASGGGLKFHPGMTGGFNA